MKAVQFELDQSERELQILAQIDKAVLDKKPLEKILTLTVEELKSILDADDVHVFYRVANTVKIAVSTEPRAVNEIVPLDRQHRSALTGKYVTARDSAAVSRLGDSRVALMGNTASAVAIRIDQAPEPFAMLVATSCKPKYFRDHKPLIEAVARQLSIAIRYGLLIPREAMQPFYDEIDGKFFSNGIRARADVVESILGIVSRRLAELLGSENDARVQILFPEVPLMPGSPSTLKIVHSLYSSEPEFAVATEESVSGRAFASKMIQIVSDVKDEQHYVSMLGETIISECAIPVVIGAQVVAVVNVESPRADCFRGYYANVLDSFCRKVSFTLAFARIQSDVAERLERQHASETFMALGLKTGDIIHRVRGDMGAIKASIFRSSDELDRDEFATFKENILMLAESASQQVDGFRDSILPRIVKVNAEIQSLIEELKVPNNVEVTTELQPDLPDIECLMLREAIENLVQNAFDALHRHAEGRVVIQTMLVQPPQPARNTYIQIAVNDNGPGIDPAVQHRIFELGISTKATVHELRSGMGFGLFLVRMVVRRAGGEINVDSPNGQGTKMTILLPVSN